MQKVNKRGPLSIILIFSLFLAQNMTAQSYCASKGNLPWQEWIANVQIGTINNASQKEGYGNFTSQTVSLAQGSSTTLTVTQGFSWPADPTNATQQGRAWIDYNKNGTFEDTEIVATFTRSTTTATILIPTTATTGATRMRITLKTIGLPTACETFDKGEVEDYTVNITGGGQNTTCPNRYSFVTCSPTIGICSAPSAPPTGFNKMLGSRLEDGQFINLFRSGRSIPEVYLWTGTSVAPPTIATSFSNISGNWLYFRASGYYETGEDRPLQTELNDIWIRVKSAGSASNPLATLVFEIDSISVRASGLTADALIQPFGYFSTFEPIRDCNMCSTTDRTPSTINCPTTTVTYNTTTIGKISIAKVLSAIGVRVTDNCVFSPTPFIIGQPIDVQLGQTYQRTVVVRDTAGNRTTCNLSIVVPNPNANQPDLTLANLTIPTPSVQQGQILNFNVDAKNIGTAAATGSFTIKSYLSTDQVLDASDYQNGTIPTANYAVGTNIPQIGGAMSVSNAVAAGNYYLILKIDADNQIAESNENNNVIVFNSTISVTSPTTSCPPQYRAFPISNNTPCGSVNVDTLGSLGTFTLYQRTNNPADGFDIVGYNGTLASTNNYVLYLRNGTTTPPAGLPIINCSTGAATNNWLYFTNVTGNVFNQTRGGCYCAPQIVTNGVVQVGIGAHGTGVDGFGVLVNALNGANLTIPLAIRAYGSTPNCVNCLTDNIKPTLVCPNDTTIVTTQPTGSNFTYSYRIPTATDNCSPYVSVYGDASLPTFIPVGGAQTITYTAVDPNNNSSTCRFNVTVSNNSNPTSYCASKGIAPWEYAIANVTLNTLNNNSDKFKDFSTLGYSDYTNLTTTLNQGQTYPLSITPLLSWIGNIPNAFARVWIDFNQNKTFEANELVLEKTNANPLTQSVLIPTTALTGATRMRVSLKNGSYPTACEAFDKGEVEDYAVNIAAGTGGGTPELVISNVTGPTSALPGSQITLVVTVTNTGTAPTVPTKMQYTQNEYANGFTAPLTNDILTIAPLAPNETRVINYTLRLINPIYPPNSTYLRGSRDFRPFNFASYYVQATNGNSSTDQAPFYTEARFQFNIPMTFPSANISVNVVPNKTSLAVGETWSATYSVKNNSNITVKQALVNLGGFAKFNLNQSTGSYALAGTRNLSPNSTLRYGSGEETVVGLEVLDLAAGETRSVTLDFSTPLTRDTIPSTTLLFLPVVNVFSNVINTNTSLGTPITINYNAAPQNLPDLTISNLVVPSSNVQVGAGRVLGFRFDVGNNSTVAVPNSFRIKSYFSTDQILSADDLVRGDFSTGNYLAGFSVNVGNSIDATIPEGQYYLIVKIDADNEIAESNEGNNTVVSQLLTMTSSTGGGGSDIALSITADPSVYRAYSTQNLRIRAVNSGTTAFTNVKIKFTRPASTVNGGNKVPSIGTFNDYCPGGIECSEWIIPTLAGGITATLDAPIYVLAPTGSITATAAILSSTPTDNVVANNTASVTLNAANAPLIQPVNQTLIQSKPTQLVPVLIQKISPTITENFIVVEFESIVEKTIEFDIINSLGTNVLNEKMTIEKGNNKRHFDVSNLPKGLYFIQTSVGKGRNVPMKFIKL